MGGGIKLIIMAEKESAGQLLIPMEKVAGELVAQLKSQPMLQLTLPAYASLQDAAKIYHREYARLFRLNQTLNNDLVDTISRRNELAEHYNQIKVTPPPLSACVSRMRQSAASDDTPATSSGSSSAPSSAATGGTARRGRCRTT